MKNIHPPRPDPIPEHIRTGLQGEQVAQKYLEGLGYQTRDKNVHIGTHDEIDLVVFDPTDDVIVFAEVKARARLHADYRPELNITPRKRRALARAARAWIAENDWRGGYRMDVVCVAGGEVVAHYREIAWGE